MPAGTACTRTRKFSKGSKQKKPQALLGRNTPNKFLMRHNNLFGIETNEAEFPGTFPAH